MHFVLSMLYSVVNEIRIEPIGLGAMEEAYVYDARLWVLVSLPVYDKPDIGCICFYKGIHYINMQTSFCLKKKLVPGLKISAQSLQSPSYIFICNFPINILC